MNDSKLYEKSVRRINLKYNLSFVDINCSLLADLHKLEEWNTLVSCDLSSQDWFVSSSETESSSEEDDDDDEPMDTD